MRRLTWSFGTLFLLLAAVAILQSRMVRTLPQAHGHHAAHF